MGNMFLVANPQMSNMSPSSQMYSLLRRSNETLAAFGMSHCVMFEYIVLMCGVIDCRINHVTSSSKIGIALRKVVLVRPNAIA